MIHLVTIDKADGTFFAGFDEQVRVRACLLGQEKNATRTKVDIAVVQREFADGCEVVGD